MIDFLRLFVVIGICMHHPLAVAGDDVSDDTQHSLQKTGRDVTKIDEELLNQLSEEEQQWYYKFQNGLVLFSGWKEISEEVLDCLPPEERPGIRDLLETMGIRIGTEWSKDNSERKIDTDQLQSWGDRLRQARSSGGRQLTNTLKKIAIEVNDILDLEPYDKIASDTP